MTEKNDEANQEGAGRLRPRKAVMQFARRMEVVLREHDWKGGWKAMRDVHTVVELREQAQELQDAIAVWSYHYANDRNAGVNRVLDSALDVANYAMMLLDNRDR